MRKLIAIIPARGGSKRLENKNIYPLRGKPLIHYSIEACQQSSAIHKIFVSTDSSEIASVSRQAGASVIIRPDELADDQTPKIIAIRQAIEQLTSDGVVFDDVAIIQANSPQILSSHIDEAYALMLTHNLWEVMSADSNGVQNAAIRIIRKEVAFQQFLSAHCGFVTCDLLDVHTIEDIGTLEKRMT
jgi:CMP-N,N'-diacetyllegionaminic acid synthase